MLLFFGLLLFPPLTHTHLPGMQQRCASTIQLWRIELLYVLFIGSLKAGFVTERSVASSCRAYRAAVRIVYCELL
jgi:hypothetical protein